MSTSENIDNLLALMKGNTTKEPKKTFNANGIFNAAISELVDAGITSYFLQSPKNDNLLVSFISCYLVVAKSFKPEQLAEFTIAHFINFRELNVDGITLRVFADPANTFPEFVLTEFEFHCMEIYYNTVRSKYERRPCDLFLFDCNGNNVHSIIDQMFDTLKNLTNNECGSDQITVFEAQESFTANFISVPKLRNPLLIKPIIVYNAQKAAVRHIMTSTSYSAVDNSFRPRFRGLRRPAPPKRSMTFSHCIPSGTQHEIFERCITQTWDYLAVREDCGIGRGIIVAVPFQKNEVLLDYHGRYISQAEHDQIWETDDETDRRSDYLYSTPCGSIDSSDEECICHPSTRLLGRLINHASQESPACNVTPRSFRHKGRHFVLFVAGRNIAALEELRFDYDRKNCDNMFVHQ